MRYRSRPVEVEAMQWESNNFVQRDLIADQIVAWVNTSGGEARYEAATDAWYTSHPELWPDRHPARIAVHTINGWADAAPGHYVVKGTAGISLPGRELLVDFYPCDPATFEQRWEPVAPAGSGESE